MHARTRTLGPISGPGSPVSFFHHPTDTVVKVAPSGGVSRVSLRDIPCGVSDGHGAVGKSWGVPVVFSIVLSPCKEIPAPSPDPILC